MSATAAEPDLWPADLEPKGEPAPAAILRQQGYRLGKRTRDALYGEVESQHVDGKLRHTMFLTASGMKLRRPLVFVEHPILPHPYPARVSSLSPDFTTLEERYVGDASELRGFLKEIFQHPLTVELIRALLANDRDLDEAA